MLSAKQNENRAEPTVPRVSPPSGGTVGKVVNSIQGLQQRLNDYTLEEIVAAENRSRTLMLGLLNLQSRVDSLIAIKRSMTVVFDALQKTTSEDVKLSLVNTTTGKSIHLHDIIQASNLIKFPGIKRTSNQSAGKAITDRPGPGEIIPGDDDRPKSTRDLTKQSTTADRSEAINSPNEPAFVFGATEIDTASEVPSADFSWDKDTDLDKEISDDIRGEQEIQAATTRSAAPESYNTIQADPCPPESAEELPLLEESNTPTSKALVPTGGDFDQRLLDDLIKNYGEFFSSSSSSPKVASQTNLEAVESGSKPILHRPAAEMAKTNTARTAPLKKEGDIDRELKKIIKDYGEYDIYSRHNRINLKFAAIGAFLLLGAVFSGFYFLSSSRSPERSSPSAATEPVSKTSDEHASGIRELKQPAKASETKTPQSKSPIVKK
jgi:hypothetical protein